MIRMLRRLWRGLRAEDGTATIEFVILFPIFMVMSVTGVEMGVLSLRQVMLERAIDLTVRKLRVGAIAEPDFQTVKASICANSLMIPDCMTALHLELTPISTASWSVPRDAGDLRRPHLERRSDRQFQRRPAQRIHADARLRGVQPAVPDLRAGARPAARRFGRLPSDRLDFLRQRTMRTAPMLSRLLRPFRRFAGDAEGSLSLEAAIMVPTLVFAMSLMYTAFDAFRFDATNSKAAYTVGDLLSRETDPVDQSFINGMKSIFDYITLSKASDTWLRVTVVRYDGDDEEMKVVWSHATAGIPSLTQEHHLGDRKPDPAT